MTLKELWALFPIFLKEHDPRWAAMFAGEAAVLKAALDADKIVRIAHVGSTAVADIWAKPIVDILVEVSDGCAPRAFIPCIEACGYIVMHAGNKRVDFNKGYTPDGFAREVFHLHLRRKGDNAECYFRDYLNEFPDTAKAYEALKLKLWKKYAHDRDAYTEAKTVFVQKYTQIAMQRYQDRYS